MPRKTLTKTAFVAGLPETMSSTEVVAKAKTININLTVRQVSKIRHRLRLALNKGSRSTPPAPPTVNRPKLRTRTNGHSAVIVNGVDYTNAIEAKSTEPSLEELFEGRGMRLPAGGRVGLAPKNDDNTFKSIALQIGLKRARSLLDSLEAALLKST
jgi:hypothetical protein